MVHGYARVSTKGQARDGNSLEAQTEALVTAGANRIWSDAYTGAKMTRPEFSKMCSEMKKGDRLIVTKIDRLARTAVQGTELIQEFLDKGIAVHVLNMGLIDNTPTGRLIMMVLLAFAEFERDTIIERTQEGKAYARQREGFRDGRPKKYSRALIRHAVELCSDHPISVVVDMTGISRSTLMRAKREFMAEQREEIV